MTTFPTATPDCSIALISELFGLSLRAIRFYEEQELVRPRRDALNRRRYGPVARRRLQLIAKLRQAGLSIDEIRCLLGPAGEAPAARQSALIVEAIRARLDQLQAATHAALDVLRDLLAGETSGAHATPLRRSA
jgi:DNA-binding transcriptional MerR regulator